MTRPAHIPVLVAEVVAWLRPRDGGVYVDATFGAGGYSQALLDAALCQVWAIDRDPDAIAAGAELRRRYDGRLDLIHGDFADLEALLTARGVGLVDGVAFDLGVSSMQLDQPLRGFSFRHDGPLDMRMSKSGASAADLVNDLGEAELALVIADYGDERHARRIARAIVRARAATTIRSTGALADIVRQAYPGGGKGEPIDPATRTFQALRIAVNGELAALDRGLVGAERVLAAGGRLAVVSFHSLEDRRVKRFLLARSGQAPRASRHRPEAAAGPAASFVLTQRRPVSPGIAESAANPRARSARLRVAERSAAPPWPAPADAAEA
jgi:16S rRNA (cytosine1402-N4)-methyltransferase